MNKSATVLLFLVLLFSGRAVELSNLLPTISTGKLPLNLLTEITAKITAGAPIDDIHRLLDNLEEQIRKEQVNHESLYSRQDVECKSERAFRRKEIADATSALNRATEGQNQCQISLTQRQNDLQNNIKSQTELENALQTLQLQRTTNHANFELRQRQINEALQALDGGSTIILKLFKGTATLLDLSKYSITLMKQAIQNQQTEFYAPFIAALAQVAQKTDMLIDQNILQRVQELLKQLQKRLRKSLKTEQDDEALTVKEYSGMKSSLEEQIAKLKANEKILRENISEYKSCTVQSGNTIAQASTKRERNQAMLTDAEKMCKTFESEYKTASKQRKTELDILEKLRVFMKNKGSMLHDAKGGSEESLIQLSEQTAGKNIIANRNAKRKAETVAKQAEVKTEAKPQLVQKAQVEAEATEDNTEEEAATEEAAPVAPAEKSAEKVVKKAEPKKQEVPKKKVVAKKHAKVARKVKQVKKTATEDEESSE